MAVGIESITHMKRVQKARTAADAPGPAHVTRHMPKRRDEILDGGSIYGVIKGFIRVRQRLVGIEPVMREDGRHCRLVLDWTLVPTEPEPRQPHQGWRYLEADKAPADLKGQGKGGSRIPPEMAAELKSLGLL